MKTRNKQILVAVLLAITIISPVANADSKAQASQSFDQLYASVMTTQEDRTAGVTVSGNMNALVAFSIPSTRVTKSRTITVTVSGYNSEVGQTDSNPFEAACKDLNNKEPGWHGIRVHDGMVAANVIDANGRNLPCGTLIKIPSLYGNKIFVVEDRMNERYTNNVDIWFTHKADALKLGRRTIQIEVIK